ncbi:hypothetical protein Bca52824_058697 [Brassica carinata]|uniref:Uncharacterized protein n=1 Tax=Brassica carinata TaxID=52824 RepID=A0A8X7QTP7_BRACI|nr:hypothetical protein Bca52824_058697 [Brassica carinata]
MHQRSMNNLQNRMHVNEVDKEILKSQWTRGDEAIRSFIGTWFQMSEEDVNRVSQQTSNTGVNTRFIAACYCELKVEYETDTLLSELCS